MNPTREQLETRLRELDSNHDRNIVTNTMNRTANGIDHNGVDHARARVDVLCALSYALRNNDRKRAKHLAHEAKAFAEQNDYALGAAEAEFVMGVVECASGEYEPALMTLFRAIETFQDCGTGSHERFGEARALRWIGICYLRISMPTTALEYISKAQGISEQVAEQLTEHHQKPEHSTQVEPIADSTSNDSADNRDNLESLSNLDNVPTVSMYGTMSFADVRFHEAQCLTSIGDVYFALQEYKSAMGYFRESLRLVEEFDHPEQRAIALNSIGYAYTEMQEYSRAHIYFQQSLAIRRQLDDSMGIGTTMAGMADAYARQGKFADALNVYFQVFDMAVGGKNMLGMAWSTAGIGEVYFKSGKIEKALEHLHRAEALMQQIGSHPAQAELYKNLAASYKLQGDTARALEYFEQHHAIFSATVLQDNKQALRFLQRGFEIEKTQKEAEIYRLKNVELVHVNRQNEELLLNILPSPIAARLKGGATRIADKFDNVTALFADIVGFTKLSAQTSPEMLVGALDVVFSMFDELAHKYDLEKIKTIGDAYMIVGGAPERRDDHCEAVASFALDAMQMMQREFWRSFEDGIFAGIPLQLRIGIHTGEAVAGVIGKKKFSYDLWGDTINTASRMESHSEAGKIHVTEEVYCALGGAKPSTNTHALFSFEQRGEIDVKGKGKMNTYFLLGKTPL